MCFFVRLLTFSVVWVEMCIRYLQNFKRWSFINRSGKFPQGRLRDGWERHFPLMVRVVDVTTRVAYDKTADLIRAYRNTFQYVNYFTLKYEKCKVNNDIPEN